MVSLPRSTRWRFGRRCRRRCRSRPPSDCPSGWSSPRTSSPPRRWPTSPSTPHATSVTMRVWRSEGTASIEIADDGVGGADDASGSGLRGLADRVEALDGHLLVRSAARRRDGRHRGAAMRVVIADDNLLTREGIAALLRARGYRRGRRRPRRPRSCCARSTRTRPMWRSSTSACRPPTRTRACARRTRSARGTRTSRIVILSQHVDRGPRCAC